ncbi:helix-turn-helix transcriptional regulator [Saccharopolyspora hirsuta]|uniref:Helix-turn-helix domain-containing protein n=1 Tax=Saccharopolyspora hirsuta TaxID=1837 RepID=A0A5M7BPR9_SACHI|nr:helix-turn-helix transcriptional regulator [Saccharopolyspora hirsuta]KAA5830207.1 helix-turn-helix domain-containing protein [Saccharopolyspora hirsuta]
MARTAKTNPRARVLGAELRQLREAAGLGVRELGRRLGVGHTTVWRYESGVKPPSPEDTASVLTALGVTGAEKDRIVKMARTVRDPNWLTSGVPGIREELAALMEFERTARQITEVGILVFSGLLQTREYMRAVMDSLPADRVETRIAFRLSRREILDREDGPHLVSLVAEAALWERIGGARVMADQLRYLAKVSKRSNVTIQVLPAGATTWHPAHAGPFILFEFDDQQPIVHLEHYRTSAFLRNVKDVRDYCDAADSLRRSAMSPEESRELIVRRAEAIESELD